MAKKSVEDNKESSFSFFNSITGAIATLITVGTTTFFIGWAIGSWRAETEYENTIRDYKFEKLQLELEYQKRLQEEKDKWENDQEQRITLQEISLFVKNFNEYKKGK